MWSGAGWPLLGLSNDWRVQAFSAGRGQSSCISSMNIIPLVPTIGGKRLSGVLAATRRQLVGVVMSRPGELLSLILLPPGDDPSTQPGHDGYIG